MTKREKYGLSFLKIEGPFGNVRHECRTLVIGAHSRLQILTFLNIEECKDLVDEITNAQRGEYFDEIFSADASGNDSIKLVPSNITINNDSLISMSDMKDLLLEWINFSMS